MSILCSRRLWRLVKAGGLPESQAGATAAGCRLGPWAATLSKEDERTLVVAIEMCTGLTVVCLVEQIVTFHDAFAEALGFALEDLGVSHEPILFETTAVKTLPLRPFADAGVQENLETIDFMCGIELSYADDLRIVQRRLNDFPRDLPPHYVPAVAVQSLFAPGRAIREEP